MTRAAISADPGMDVEESIVRSFETAEGRDRPFPHWRSSGVLPEPIARALFRLPLAGVRTGGVSGRRELHNDQRRYLAGEMLGRFPAARQVAEAFAAPRVVQAIAMLTGALLLGAFLRIEYAVDLDGFWLEPHTDLGVKVFTLLLHLGTPGQQGLGTDLYAGSDLWTERIPFGWNTGIVFVPSAATWHGFEPRPIEGARRSLIVNYVTADWRAREQLAFPDRPVEF